METIIDIDKLTRIIANAVIEKKGMSVSVLNLENMLSYSERFVICSGASSRQVRAIAQHVMQVLKKEHDMLPVGVEGQGIDQWVLVDFGSVILHIFTNESRGYYTLDSLWTEAPQIPLEKFGISDPDAEAHPDTTMFM